MRLFFTRGVHIHSDCGRIGEQPVDFLLDPLCAAAEVADIFAAANRAYCVVITFKAAVVAL